MTIRKSLKALILFLLSCILISVNCINSIAYYELPHEKGSDTNVKIGKIYYNLSIFGHKEGEYTIYAFYPFANGDTLKMPDKINYKGRKYKVNYVSFNTYEEDYYGQPPILPSKLTLPYKTIYLPKYTDTFHHTESMKLPNLKKLYVPKNTHELIGINDMPKLKVIIDKKNPYIKMKNGAVYSKDGKTMYCLVNSKKKYKISKGTTSVDFGSNKTVEKVILPSSVINLNSGAFDWCFKLKSVKLNEQLKIIEGYAFEKCKSLKSITIPKNVEEIQFWAFKNCRKLSKVKIESEEKAPIIEDTAFKNTKDGIKFYVKNQTVADQLNEQLKGSGVRKAKILIGKKVVYKNVK